MARRELTNDEKLTQALKQAQAIATFEASGLNHHYRIQKNDGVYPAVKIPHHSGGVTNDVLVALAQADLQSSGASGRVPDTSVAARTPRAELVEALNTLDLLSANSPLYSLRSYGDHGDTAGRSAAGTADDIKMALIDDMDKNRNPVTLASFGEPFIEKFIDENGVEQEVLVRETIQGGHIKGAAEFPEDKHNPTNIIGELQYENLATAGREPRPLRNGIISREVNDDEFQLRKAVQEFTAEEGQTPGTFISRMEGIAEANPRLKPRITEVFSRMGLRLR